MGAWVRSIVEEALRAYAADFLMLTDEPCADPLSSMDTLDLRWRQAACSSFAPDQPWSSRSSPLPW